MLQMLHNLSLVVQNIYHGITYYTMDIILEPSYINLATADTRDSIIASIVTSATIANVASIVMLLVIFHACTLHLFLIHPWPRSCWPSS